MLLLQILHWLMGYVRFSVEKGSPGRFLNQCVRSGVHVWNIYSGDGYGACIHARGYRRLLSCAHKSGAVLRVRERRGLPFRTAKVRKRKGLLWGSVLFVAILALLSMHYWSINVAGNTEISTGSIEAKLTELGVAPGVWKRQVDSQLLQQQLMSAFPEIRWLSVNTNGCTLTVQLEEAVKKPDVDASRRVCNVKAAVAGQVLYMEVYGGAAEVSRGDAVTPGQLLINGVMEDNFGGSTLHHAAGKVIAATSRTFTAQAALTREEAVPTGRRIVRKSVSVFGLRLPLTVSSSPEGDWRLEACRNRVRLCGVLLPVSLYTETWTEEARRTVPVTQEEALENARDQVRDQQKAEMKDGRVISMREKTRMEGNVLLYTVEAECEEDIARESELFVNT